MEHPPQPLGWRFGKYGDACWSRKLGMRVNTEVWLPRRECITVVSCPNSPQLASGRSKTIILVLVLSV